MSGFLGDGVCSCREGYFGSICNQRESRTIDDIEYTKYDNWIAISKIEFDSFGNFLNFSKKYLLFFKEIYTS